MVLLSTDIGGEIFYVTVSLQYIHPYNNTTKVIRFHQTIYKYCVVCWWLYLVVPGLAVKAQSTASGISTLQIQIVQVKTGQHPSRVVHNCCRIGLCNIKH